MRRRSPVATALAAATLLPLALLNATARPAHADEDAGTLSPLAEGAGNRALAMGGAFTSVADDASAAVWNPAGLASLPRLEVQASRASLYGLEVAEDYAAVGWPTWRWGTFALDARRLGVEDVERRDDRNILVGDFDASEMEVNFAWGKALDDAWNVGAGLKLARQSVAGRTGTGLGADVGVLGRPGVALGRREGWASRLSVGVELRNLVSPSIRLEQESVDDPLELRAGASYRHPMAHSGGILVALDVTHASDVDPEVRVGTEASLHPLLALRAGWDGDDATAGLGIRWHGTSFDYAWEDDPLADVHRFGISVAFGPTVQESRLAAERAEEEAFRARLADSFRRREEERIAELLSRGNDLLANGRIEEAIEAGSTLRAIAPDDPRARDLEARALAARAAQLEERGDLADAIVLYGRSLALVPNPAISQAMARCRTESDARAARSATIRDLFGRALDAFGAGDLAVARDRFRSILALSPEDAEARSMLNRTDAAISARAAELLARAREATDRGMLADADRLIGAAAALEADPDGVRSATTRLRRAEAALQAAARSKVAAADSARTALTAPVVKAPVVSRKTQQELADLYRRGREALEADRPEDAIRYWEMAWSLSPTYENVAELLEREYLLRGLEVFSRGRFDDAIAFWEKALVVDPSDERTLGYLSRAREQLTRSREILGEGE